MYEKKVRSAVRAIQLGTLPVGLPFFSRAGLLIKEPGRRKTESDGTFRSRGPETG